MSNLSITRARAVKELAKLNESELSKVKLHFEYHQTFSEIRKQLRRKR